MIISFQRNIYLSQNIYIYIYYSFYTFLRNCQIFTEYLLQPVSILVERAPNLHLRNLYSRGNDTEQVVSSVLHVVKEPYSVLRMHSAKDLTYLNGQGMCTENINLGWDLKRCRLYVGKSVCGSEEKLGTTPGRGRNTCKDYETRKNIWNNSSMPERRSGRWWKEGG